MLATLLLLADGRFPSGGHAHSGGLEPAVNAGRVSSPDDLDAFLRGRLATAGLVAAAFAAASAAASVAASAAGASASDASACDASACGASATGLAALDEALDARTPSPAQRRASRAQGRALLRAGRAVWGVPRGPARGPVRGSPPEVRVGPPPGWAGQPTAPHHPVALGVVAAAAGLAPEHAALAAAHGAVSGPASAAVRLLGLDPYAVTAVLARLAPECERVAGVAARYAGANPDDLPAGSAPLWDIGAEDHARWEVRLFAS